MKLETTRLTARTRHPFRIARPHSSVEDDTVHRLVLRLEHDGVVGFGEAAPTAYYGQSLDSAEEALRQIAALPEWDSTDPFHVVPITDHLVEAFDDQRAAVAAVDAALHDWIGKRLGVPVWRLLGLDPSATPPTSMTIGIDEPNEIARKVAEAAPFGHLKIKVGTDRDEEILSVVRKHAPYKRLRLDANTAWTPENALEHIKALARFEPELIEQPLVPGRLDALEELHRRSPVPIYVDEDSVRPSDVLRLSGRVSGVNVKLAKCGGIRPALAMISLARHLNLRVMIGCMVETSLGISAAAHIASLADEVDLDGHLLLADDPFAAVALERDHVLPHDRPGLGADASRLF